MRRRLLPPLTLAALVVPLVPAAAAPAAQLGQRPLERGDRGTDVKDLQRTLTKLRAGRLAADGAYGARTASAVRRYERRQRLAVDGRVSIGQIRGILKRAGRPMPAPAPAEEQAPARTPRVAGGDVFPVQGKVTWGDGFGERSGGHDGVDLLADCGTPLVAITGSEVRAVSSHGAAGRYVLLTSPDGSEWVYMHLQRVDVEAGQRLAAGDPVGTVGASGNATACHLHAERWTAPGWQRGGTPEDPEPALRALQ